MKRKIFLFILLSSLVLTGCVNDSLNNQILKNPKSTDSTNSQTASDWVDYIDIENGFSVKYPAGWVIKPKDERLYPPEKPVYIGFYPKGYNQDTSTVLNIEVYDAGYYTVDSLISDIQKDAIERKQNIEKIRIGDIDAFKVKISFTVKLVDANDSKHVIEEIFVQGNQRIYRILYPTYETYKKEHEIFYNSFKLLK